VILEGAEVDSYWVVIFVLAFLFVTIRVGPDACPFYFAIGEGTNIGAAISLLVSALTVLFAVFHFSGVAISIRILCFK